MTETALVKNFRDFDFEDLVRHLEVDLNEDGQKNPPPPVWKKSTLFISFFKGFPKMWNLY